MIESADEYALFLFAHQDDEVFAMPWMKQELALGKRLACVFLTDGASRTDVNVRNEESRRVLTVLGIEDGDIYLPTDATEPDGQLVNGLYRTEMRVASWIGGRRVTAVYAPDWEGGHQDHDAAHLLALSIAKRLSVLDNGWGFSLYNAYRSPVPLFRVLTALPGLGKTIKHTFAAGLRYAMLCWNYPSQRRTWLGLFPGIVIARLVRRKESARKFDVDRIRDVPHDGQLLYERMFGYSAQEFSTATYRYVSMLLERETR